MSHVSIISKTLDIFPYVLRTKGSSEILCTQKRQLSSLDSPEDAGGV